MKKIYLLLFIFICFNAKAQLSPKCIKAFDEIKVSCKGDAWSFNDVSELQKRTKAPYITLTNPFGDSDYPGKGSQSFMILDLSNNNLDGFITKSLFYNPEYKNYPAFWYSSQAKLRLSHNKIKSFDDLLCFTNFSYINEVRLDNNELTAFKHSPKLPNSQGLPLYQALNIFTIHQNEIEEISIENITDSWGYSLIDNLADTVRFDNNRLDFKNLVPIVEAVNQATSYISWANKGNPDCYLDYYPQKPLGGDYTEKTLNKGESHNLSFNLSHNRNVYTWQRNGVDIPMTESTKHTVVVNNATAGVWRCKVTNKRLPEVTLYSYDMGVFMNKPGNKSVTDIAFTQNKLFSKFPEASIIGDFTSIDPDGDDVFYRLPDKTADNSHFRIKDGKTLISAEILFDRDYIENYEIVVEAYDVYGGKFRKTIEIVKDPISNSNLPTKISLSKNSVDENLSDFKIGKFSVTTIGDCVLSLNKSEKDNGYFKITNDTLKTLNGLDYEEKSKYSIRLTATNSEGNSIKKDFDIKVTNANDAPNNIILTNNVLITNNKLGETIGILVASDQDVVDKEFEFTLVESYKDNFSFGIVENTLKVRETFVEASLKYIKIRAADDAGSEFEKEFIIVIKEEDAPVTTNLPFIGFGLSNSIISSETKIDDVIGTFFMSDPEGQLGSYECENEYVYIEGNNLRLKSLIDPSTGIEVSVLGIDGEFVNELNFTIFNKTAAVIIPDPDINNKPLGFGLTNANISKLNKVGDVIGLFYLNDKEGSVGEFSCSNDYLEIEGLNLKLKSIPTSDDNITLKVTCVDGSHTITQNLEVSVKLGYSSNESSETSLRGFGITSTVIESELEEGTLIGQLYMSDESGVEGTFTCDNQYIEIIGAYIYLRTKPDEGTNFEASITCSNSVTELTQEFIFYITKEGTVTGIESGVINKSISLYPNPTSDFLQIDGLDTNSQSNFTIYNVNGIVVKNVSSHPINVQDINPGTYILSFKDGEKLVSEKFIKQ